MLLICMLFYFFVYVDDVNDVDGIVVGIHNDTTDVVYVVVVVFVADVSFNVVIIFLLMLMLT